MTYQSIYLNTTIPLTGENGLISFYEKLLKKRAFWSPCVGIKKRLNQLKAARRIINATTL